MLIKGRGYTPYNADYDVNRNHKVVSTVRSLTVRYSEVWAEMHALAWTAETNDYSQCNHNESRETSD